MGLIWQKSFVNMKGPFNLHAFSRPVAAVACAWIGCITVVFCLPTSNPVTDQTFNYSVVAVGIIGLGSIAAWLLWARKWFTGPALEVVQAMRLGVDASEPGALEAKAGLADDAKIGALESREEELKEALKGKEGSD
jgi:hypothetical protein